MKKNGIFKILCLVLVMALLSPHVFAATPAPEVPLADAATVARVKQEIAAGQITDMEDVFLVAYQHLDADIEEDGMTAYINPDGTLGFTQIISTTRTRNGSTEQKLAVTSIALLNSDGTRSTVRIDSITGYDSGSLSNISVYATHTAFIWRESTLTSDLGIADYRFKLDEIVTTINYNTVSFVPTKLVQEYYAEQNFGGSSEANSKTTNNPSNGSHSFSPGNASWFDSGQGITGSIKASAKVYISNTSSTIDLCVTYSLADREFT